MVGRAGCVSSGTWFWGSTPQPVQRLGVLLGYLASSATWYYCNSLTQTVLGEAQKELLDDEKRENLLKFLEMAKGAWETPEAAG